MEKRCKTCKWYLNTGLQTQGICRMPVPIWVQGLDSLNERRIIALDTRCTVWTEPETTDEAHDERR